MATLNVTHANIESAIKRRENSAQNTIQNSKQPSENKLKSLTFTAKKFFGTHTNDTPLAAT